MSISAYQLVWQNSEQTGGMKLTLLALADFANGDLICWPSIKTIARMVGVSDRQIKNNLLALEEAGEIAIERQVGRGNTNIYSLKPLLKGEAQGVNSEAGFTIIEAEKVKPSTEKVKPSTIKGEAHFTRSIIEPIEPSSNGTGQKEEPSPIEELIALFIAETNCRQPKGYELTDRWLNPLIAIYRASGENFQETTRRIIAAIAEMREKRLTIATPASIQNIAVGMTAAPRLEIRAL